MAIAVAKALAAFGAQPRELPLTPTYVRELVQAGLAPRGRAMPGPRDLGALLTNCSGEE
jgi:hypothetical protein